MTIPRHRIPKISATCPHCESERGKIVMAQAFAPGYHRRHVCRDCGGAFYTLADYHGGEFHTAFSPFKDRTMSPWEKQERLNWWAEAKPVTTQVTPALANEFLETISEVMTKQAKGIELTDKETKLAAAIAALEIEWDNT